MLLVRLDRDVSFFPSLVDLFQLFPAVLAELVAWLGFQSFLVDFYDMYVVPWNGLLQPTPGFTTALEVLCRVAMTAISR